VTLDGKQVHVWIRDGKYLARGRHQGRAFGQQLGADERDASGALRRLLVELEDGTFQTPSEARQQQVKAGAVPRSSVRHLCQVFLADKRKLRGKKTAADYRNRLAPLIEFAELPDVAKRWSLAAQVDREFVVRFREYLHQRRVARNGRVAAEERPHSPGQIFNILDCSRTLFGWGVRPDVHQLPSGFANPFTKDLAGTRPRKDPLRPMVFPMQRRMALVEQMDVWQLCHFAIAMVLPLRPEDYTGLLISEVDFQNRILHFGTRLAGWDFNKGQQTFQVPFPPEIAPFLRMCMGDRRDGPLLQQRTVFEQRRRPKLPVTLAADIQQVFDRALAAARPGEVQAKQDGKRIFRRLLCDMGGVSPDSLAKEFQSLLQRDSAGISGRFYDLRGSVTTDLKDARVDHLLQLYVTGHSLNTDILSNYVSIRLHDEMAAYFQHIRPLLETLSKRAEQLGIV